MKTYKNISGVEQLEIPPGETGERELPQDQEDRMVARGAIEVVGEAAEAEAPETEQPTVGEVKEGEEFKTPEQIEAEQKAAEEAEAAKQAEEKAAAERKAAEEQQRGRGRGRG